MPYRHDLVEIQSPTMDQNGYLVADAFPTRAGVFKYVKADGSISLELRHPDDVFAPASLNSLKHRPIVDEHPDGGPMNSVNTRGLGVGHVGEQVSRSGNHVKANVVITDVKMIAKMQGKGGQAKRELSCGYTADVVDETGIWEGQPYNARQTNIVYNHLASVWKGRAGSSAQIHLDGEDAVSDSFNIEIADAGSYGGGGKKERRKAANPCNPCSTKAKKKRRKVDSADYTGNPDNPSHVHRDGGPGSGKRKGERRGKFVKPKGSGAQAERRQLTKSRERRGPLKEASEKKAIALARSSKGGTSKKQHFDAGGEGSRGGIVIGRTSSGKPIYNSHAHPSHKKFTSKEHLQAAAFHNKERNEKLGEALKTSGAESDRLSKEALSHGNEKDKHMESAGFSGARDTHPDLADKFSRAQSHVKKHGKRTDASVRSRLLAGRARGGSSSSGGGEGSRGGVVIGRTTSGKPIYENHTHPGHKDFTGLEHDQAAHAQQKRLGEKRKEKQPRGLQARVNKKVEEREILASVKHHETRAKATRKKTIVTPQVQGLGESLGGKSGLAASGKSTVKLTPVDLKSKEGQRLAAKSEAGFKKPIVTPQIPGLGGAGAKQALAVPGVPSKKQGSELAGLGPFKERPLARANRLGKSSSSLDHNEENSMTIKLKREAVTIGNYHQDGFEVEFEQESEHAVSAISARLDEAHRELAFLTDQNNEEVENHTMTRAALDQLVEDAESNNGAIDPIELNRLASARADVMGVASHMGLTDIEEKTDEEIKALVVSKHNPDLKMDGLDPLVIEGRYGMICDGIRAENKGMESLAALRKITTLDPSDRNDRSGESETPRERYVTDIQDMHKLTAEQIQERWNQA